jgi:hypothetical protein
VQPLSDRNFQKGFNRVYDWNLARALNRIYSAHHHLFEAEAAAPGGRRECRRLCMAAATFVQAGPGRRCWALKRVPWLLPAVLLCFAALSAQI